METISSSISKKSYVRFCISILYLIFFFTGFSLFAEKTGNKTELKKKVNEWIKNQPLRFLENKGQMSDMQGNPLNSLLYKTNTTGADLYVTTTGLSYVLTRFEEYEEEHEDGILHELEYLRGPYCRADMELVGADIRKENIVKEQQSEDFTNYYLGGICPNGIQNVYNYGKITIKNIYPGIDWVLESSHQAVSKEGGSTGGLKYNFIVHPGADPSVIKLRYKWTDKPQLQKDGSVKIHTPLGDITEGAPISYMGADNVSSIQGRRQKTVTSEYIVRGNDVGFKLGKYNRNELLVIDPTLVWATFYAGTGMWHEVSALHDDGTNIWITGYSYRANFPTLNPGGGAYFQGALGTANGQNAFIFQFNTAGVLKWATYYGGSNGFDSGSSINSDGTNVWVTGSAASTNFPIQNLAGAYNQATNAGNGDAFILKFNVAGVRQWATYYGGSGSDGSASIMSDGTTIWVTGTTASTNFPVQNLAGAYNQATNAGGNDVFILKFSTAGVCTWATYYGGSSSEVGSSITSDGINAWVTGGTSSTNFPVQNLAGAYNQVTNAGGANDAFILKFSTFSVLLWATYYGGNGSDSYIIGSSIHSDGANVCITGTTNSTNFPLQNLAGAYNQAANAGLNDVYILKFNTAGVRQWATYYGGSGYDTGTSIQSDGTHVWVAGYTQSTDFPTLDPGGCTFFQGTRGNVVINGMGLVPTDAFILQFTIAGIRKWATYYGFDGEHDGIYISSDGTNLFITGDATAEPTKSSVYPLVNPGGGAYYYTTVGPGASGFSGEHPFIGKFCILCGVSVTAVSTNPSCNTTGTATATPVGGTSPYSYLWSNAQTGSMATGLTIGVTYTITLTDNAGCSGTTTVSVTNGSGTPPSVTATSSGNLSCAATSVILTGTSSGNTMVWNGGALTNAANPATVTVVGTYTVTATDANNCTATSAVIVISDPPLIGKFIKGTANCSNCGCKEWVMVTVSGGISPYSYTWPDGYINRYKNQLCPGNYTISIKDKNGCSINMNLTTP